MYINLYVYGAITLYGPTFQLILLKFISNIAVL